MQNALQAELRKKVKPLILPLYRVYDGTECIHLGYSEHRGKRFPSKLGGNDRGLRFIKTANSHQRLLESGKEVIFALNDIVQVVQK